jgi:nucleotide-binding universal stress UspA family protein
MKTIVVGYDGEDAARRALDRAIEEARGRDARLVVVVVAEMPLDPRGLQTFGTLDDSPAPRLPLTAPPEIEAIFASARTRIDGSGVDADYTWVAGDPGAGIVAAAKEHRAALVVVGSHHHGFLSRLVGSDVAAEVERSAGCEVVAVE